MPGRVVGMSYRRWWGRDSSSEQRWCWWKKLCWMLNPSIGQDVLDAEPRQAAAYLRRWELADVGGQESLHALIKCCIQCDRCQYFTAACEDFLQFPRVATDCHLPKLKIWWVGIHCFFVMFPYFPIFSLVGSCPFFSTDLSLLMKDSILFFMQSVLKLPLASGVWFREVFFVMEGKG